MFKDPCELKTISGSTRQWRREQHSLLRLKWNRTSVYWNYFYWIAKLQWVVVRQAGYGLLLAELLDYQAPGYLSPSSSLMPRKWYRLHDRIWNRYCIHQ
jgi:hypothetical protein